ncbi:MAG TPA: serine hydrolase domain-containing protein [Nocardioides sp.]|nr:serine hydrolase domain-containing protein [Nocardioides sp.]
MSQMAAGTRATDLDAALARSVEASVAPGAQAALVRDGELLWTGAYGMADPESATPISGETVFCLASLGKTMVAALALRLVEEHRLDLDAPVAAVLDDDLPGFDVVTPRMLLTHTSGYPDLYDTPEVAALMPPDQDEPGSGSAYDPDRPFTWSMLAPGIRAPVEPGARWEYSNAGYIVLTEMLSRVLGGSEGVRAAWRSLADRVGGGLTDDVLTMERSCVPLERLARGHEYRDDGTLVDPYAAVEHSGVPTDLFGLPFGDGLFAGTAHGVALFLDGLFARMTVLESATVELMSTTTTQAATADVPSPDLTTYGMGTHRMTGGDLAWQGHRGRYGGFSSVGATDRTHGRSLVVLANCTGEESPALPIWRALAAACVRGADAGD